MNFSKLVFLLHQMDAQIQQLSTNSLTMVNDPAVRELNYMEESAEFSEWKKLLGMVQDHINLQASMSGWVSEITVWSKQAHAVVSTDKRTVLYDETMFADQLAGDGGLSRTRRRVHSSGSRYCLYPLTSSLTKHA